MTLADRLMHSQHAGLGGEPPSPGGSLIGTTVRRRKDALGEGSRRLKIKVHNRLFETIDVSKLEMLDPAMIGSKVSEAINDILNEEGRLLTDADRNRLIEEVKNELLGLGPLEPLLRDDDISDILVNGHNQVYIEKFGKLLRTDVTFQDDQHLMLIIDRIVSRVGRRVDESSPMVDARLPDGSRVNAIIPPLALDGPALSIRRFGRHRYDIAALVEKETLTWDLVEFMLAVVRARLNVLVCGGTGSGKTTMLNCLSAFVPENERIVTIEDSAELSLQQPHVVRLETRPPNLEGKGEVTQRELVRNCLRMRPDRIVVGEVRGAEVFDMLQAMSTGHDGSIATIHANSARESLGRLEMMMLLAGFSVPQRAMRQQIAAAINIVLHITRLSDGSRKVMRVSEVTGMEGDMIMIQDLFEFVRTETRADGKVVGHFRSTEIRSAYSQRLEVAGFKPNQRLFRNAALAQMEGMHPGDTVRSGEPSGPAPHNS
jgi:pilus assembly protein CpaF